MSTKKESRWLASLKEMKNFKCVVLCGLMGAVAVVLGYFTIELGPYIKIGFSSIPNQLVATLFGPVVGGLFGGTLDILKFFIKPTGTFFPGFTLDAILAGVIYGCFFYKRKVTLVRAFLSHLLVMMVINLGTTTLWLSILYGKGFFVLWPARALKNVIMWPINSLLYYYIAKLLNNKSIKSFMNI